MIIGINPQVRADVPRSAREIISRIDEISFNSTFLLELGAIAFIERLLKSGAAHEELRMPFVHRIDSDSLGEIGASSKMNNDPAFLKHLHEIGWSSADRWLAENCGALGNRSTVDLSGLIPSTDAILPDRRPLPS